MGWLEPLLARLKEKPRSAVMPLIEIINSETMEYQMVGINLGGFSWELVFNWDQPAGAWSATEQARPRSSPTMAGGLFSIYRNFFFEVGSYDEGMDVWGGENLEISFRVSVTTQLLLPHDHQLAFVYMTTVIFCDVKHVNLATISHCIIYITVI